MKLLASIRWTGKPVGINRKIMKVGAVVMNRKAYNEFKDSLAWLFLDARGHGKKRVLAWTEAVAVVIKQHVRFDIDSLVKPILDAGEMAGVYANDRQVDLIVVHKMKARKDNLIEIKIWGRE